MAKLGTIVMLYEIYILRTSSVTEGIIMDKSNIFFNHITLWYFSKLHRYKGPLMTSMKQNYWNLENLAIQLFTTNVDWSGLILNVFQLLLKPIANRNAFLQIILDWIIPIHSHLAAYFDSAFTLFIIEEIFNYNFWSEVSDNTLRILVLPQ
ncbi:hypothetical protein ACJX0J_031235 [Zea mays]